MPVGDVLPEIVLLSGSVLVLFFALFAPRRLQAWAGVLAVATLVVTVIATMLLGASPWRGLTFFDTYAVDDAGLVAKVIVALISAGVITLSVDWFRADPRHGEYYTLLLMSALGAILMASAADLMELILGILLSSTTGYVLAAYHRTSRRASEAAMKYYLLGALTNGVLVFGVALLFGLGGTTTFSGLATTLPSADGRALIVATSLVVVGIAFKMGAVPAHAWMPDVADGAPAPVAAFVLSAPKVGALIALARLALVLPEAELGWRPLVAILAALTMTLGNVAALRQDDVRRLLGWSAVSQTGYGMMAVVAVGRSALALPSLLYFLLAYALATLAAFGVVISLRGRAERASYAGLARTQPWLAASLVIGFLSFVGVPPLAGFAAKLALFGAAMDAGYAWLALLAVVNSVVSLAYYARVLGPAYFEPAVARERLLGAPAFLTTIACAAAVIAIGLWSDAVFSAVPSEALVPLGHSAP